MGSPSGVSTEEYFGVYLWFREGLSSSSYRLQSTSSHLIASSIASFRIASKSYQRTIVHGVIHCLSVVSPQLQHWSGVLCKRARFAAHWSRPVLKRFKTQTPLHGHAPATDMLYNTINGQKFATSQHLDILRCWALALRCGKFAVQQVVGLL